MNTKEIGKDVTAAFLIRIRFRQNASWQGTIQWLEARKSRHFRSFLEMTLLIRQALEKTTGGKSGVEFRSWKEKDEVS